MPIYARIVVTEDGRDRELSHLSSDDMRCLEWVWNQVKHKPGHKMEYMDRNGTWHWMPK